MFKCFPLTCLFLILSSLFGNVRSLAQTETSTSSRAAILQLPSREIHIPMDALPVLLNGSNQRIFMSRDEYESLMKKANATPELVQESLRTQAEEASIPTGAILSSANYSIRVESGRANIDGDITIEVLKSGLQAVPLLFQHVGLIRATLDDQPASMIQSLQPVNRDSAQPGAILLIEGRGVHRLKLEMVAAVSAAAAQQTLTLSLSRASVTNWSMSVPGNVEVLSGAHVRNRVVQSDSNVTQFSLIPTPNADSQAPVSIVMTLNNKLLRESRSLEVKSLILDEIAETYEQVRQQITINVLNGSENKFQIEFPDSFEIVSVMSPMLAKWNTVESADKELGSPQLPGEPRVLEVEMREAITEQAVIDVVATKRNQSAYTDSTTDWQWPRWRVLGADIQNSILGVQLEEGLQIRDLSYDGLIPLEHKIFEDFSNAVAKDVSAPKMRTVLAVYSPVGNQEIAAKIEKTKSKLRNSVNLQAFVSESKITLRAALDLQTGHEGLASLELESSEAWRLQSATLSDGNQLSFYTANPTAQGGVNKNIRTRILLARPIAPKTSARILLEFSHVPPGWLSPWSEQAFAFPHINVIDSQPEATLLSVVPEGDLNLVAKKAENLLALFDSEREALQIPNPGTGPINAYSAQVAYDWSLELGVARNKPQLSAEVFGFFQVNIEEVKASYETHLDIQQASIDRVQFSLPDTTTPREVTIGGLGDLVVKESSSQDVGKQRVWTIKLAKRISGLATFTVDFTIPRATDEVQNLPLLEIKDTIYQTGITAIEADDELDLDIVKHPRVADVGELTQARHQVGNRLLGVYSYARNDDESGTTAIKSSLRVLQSVPTSLVQNLSLTTALARDRISYHVVELTLRTVGGFIHAKLPPDATLWSITVDGAPALPQRKDDLLVIEIRSNSALSNAGTKRNEKSWGLHSLRIAYDTPRQPMGLGRRVELFVPELSTLATESSQATAIPVADMRWELWMPRDLEVSSVVGDLALVKDESSMFPFSLWNPTPWLSKQPTLGVQDAFERADGGNGLPSGKQQIPTPTVDPFGVPEGTLDQFSITPLTPPQIAQSPEANDAPSQAAKPTAGPPSIALGNKGIDGLRTLPIPFERPIDWQVVRLQGFGESSRVELFFLNDQRLLWFSRFLSALVVIIGIMAIRLTTKQYLLIGVIALLFSMGIPLISPWFYELSVIAGNCFVAILCLMGLRLLISIWSVARGTKRSHLATASSAISLGLVLGLSHNMLWAQSPDPKPIGSFEELVSMLQSKTSHAKTPIEIPSDAILVPYNPKVQPVKPGTEKIMVPYSVYTQLWNLANPDQAKQQPPFTPKEFSLSDLRVITRLDRDDALKVSLNMVITLHTDQAILVHFGFEGAVVAEARWDDGPATLRAAPNSLVLLAEGRGKHAFQASFQIPIQRQGGWRTIQARLPAAPAGELQLEVPLANTEVRWVGAPDAEQRETTEDNQTLETAFSQEGLLQFQWRPKVTETNSDQGLTVNANYRLDVQEQGLKATWDLKLDFRRGRRDQFEFELPNGWLVEKVVGKNIRGWSISEKDNKQQLQVTLLKSALEFEQLSIIASQTQRLGQSETDSIMAPSMRVPEAMLYQGHLSLYRSSLLEVRTEEAIGLVREDVPNDAGSAPSSGPLPMVPFQSYRFASSDFELKARVRQEALKLSSEVRSHFRMSRNDAQLDSIIKLTASGRSMYRVQIQVPDSWQWKAPETSLPFEWTRSEPKDGVITIDILFRQGLYGETAVRLRAVQKRDLSLNSAAEFSAPVPVIRVIASDKQQGEIHVSTDPGVDVVAEQLVRCQSNSATPMPNKAAGGAQSNLRTIIRFSSGDYSGTLRFIPRVPQVSVLTISNIKVTRRSLEETVYLEWKIIDAGIQRVEFTLPSRLKDAVVLAQMVRRIQRFPESEQADAPVRFILDLQEDVMGEYRVVVQNDSPLPNGTQEAAIPSKLTGRIESRLVTLENSGRDELLVDTISGLSPLSRGDSLWQKYSNLLGGKAAELYRVNDLATQTEPSNATSTSSLKLAFKTQLRSLVETANARIGLSRAVISVDHAGNYRATHEYRIENSSEAYLEVELPAIAKLWTVFVAGAPVKPIASPNKPKQPGATRVRLPLVRTQLGDLDYGVELRYAGRLARPGLTTRLDFPLVESININVELSQVKVLLPEDHVWYGFDGTLGQVNDEAEFLAGWLAQKNKQLSRLSEIAANDAEAFSKARAEENLRVLGADVKQQIGSVQADFNKNANLQKQLAINSSVFQQIEKQEAQSVNEYAKSLEVGNREVFNSLFENQTNYRANGNLDMAKSSQVATAQPPQVVPPSKGSWQVLPGKRGKGSASAQAPGQPHVSGDGLNTVPMNDLGNDNRALANEYKNKLRGQQEMGPRGLENSVPMGYGGGANSAIPPADSTLRNNFGVVPRPEPTLLPNAGLIPQATVPQRYAVGPGAAIDGRASITMLGSNGVQVPGYMSSLDIEFETRGRVYYFTTPRGDATLSASGYSKTIYQRAVGIAFLGIACITIYISRRLFKNKGE